MPATRMNTLKAVVNDEARPGLGKQLAGAFEAKKTPSSPPVGGVADGLTLLRVEDVDQ